MDERERSELIRIGRSDIQFDCPMDQYTTFRVGGKADALYSAKDLNGLREVISYLGRREIPYTVVGKGSNILVKDGGYKGVIVVLQGDLARIEERGKEQSLITSGGGLPVADLLAHCSHRGFSGVEFLAGIPGTVGGAVAMNAGAWGKEVGEAVREIEIVSSGGRVNTLGQERLSFSYRGVSIPKESVIVRVKLHLSSESPSVVAGRISDYLKRRKERQPLEYPSAGSVFKNPEGDYAGRLIELAGLKGKRIGGAMISPRHANFIVNTGGAKAEDILSLVQVARQKVKEETGVELELEIRVIGV